jgi:hypothetical protein
VFGKNPGPIYNIAEEIGKKSPTRSNSPIVKISNYKPLGLMDFAVKLHKNNPGVGKYDLDKKSRVIG